MFRPKPKSLILAVVVLGVLAMGSAETQAGWYHRAYWGWPSYSYYSPGWSSWYLGIRPGPIRRWAFGPYRSYYGGYGGGWYGGPYYNTSYYGSCCYNPCCCDPCCGSTITTYSAPAPAAQGAPTPTPAPPQQPPPALPETEPQQTPFLPQSTGPQTQSPVSGASGLLTIRVPAEALVFVNGYKTKSTGAVRQYVSHGLKPGASYKYEIRAEMVRQGRLVEDTQVVYLTAGGSQQVAFSFDTKPVERLATLW